MKAVTKFLTSAAGIAALGMAAPAAAQYYPDYGQGNVIGQVLNTILNPLGQQPYGYVMNPQLAVNQCSAAVQGRLRQQYSAGYGYNPYGGYTSNAYSNARVLSISRVEPRSQTTMRVRGYATSGRMASYNPYGGYGGGYPGYAGYGGYPAYGGYAGYNAAAAADLTFECDVDYRGYIYDIDIDRRY
jgi:hypothetical protein